MPENLQPPAAACRLLSCFADPALPQILGDLMEEFRERAAKSGPAFARRWYWRETLRNVAVLLRRQPALQVGTAAIAFLVLIHAVMMLAAYYAWREWATATVPIVNGLPVKPWMGWYGWSWRLAFPPAGLDYSRELYVAIAAGFGLGAIFARYAVGRLRAFRITVVCGWLLIFASFVIYVVFFIRTGARWHGNPLLFVRMLIRDFGMREWLAAAAFWVGTYVGGWRRRFEIA